MPKLSRRRSGNRAPAGLNPGISLPPSAGPGTAPLRGPPWAGSAPGWRPAERESREPGSWRDSLRIAAGAGEPGRWGTDDSKRPGRVARSFGAKRPRRDPWAEGARRGGGAGWPRAGGRSRAAPSLQGSDATYRQAFAPISVARPLPSAPAAASPMRGPRVPAAGTQPPFWLPEHAVWKRPRRRPGSDFRGLRPVGHGRLQGRGTAPCPALPENKGASRPHSDMDVLVPGDLQPVSSLSAAMCFLAISALRPGFSLSSPVALPLGGKASRLSSA